MSSTSAEPADASPRGDESPGREPTLPTRLARTLTHLATRVAPERARDLHRRLGTLLTLGLALSALGLWGFGSLTEGVLEGETRSFDQGVLRAMHESAHPTVDTVAGWVTTLGDIPALLLVVLVASALLWAHGHRREVGVLATASVGGMILNALLKNVFGRPRPRVFEAQVEVMTLSFPSGHAMNTVVVFTTLLWILVRTGASGALRWTATAVAALLAAAVGLSRIYLGVHFPSDVAGGFAVGFAWAVLCAAAFQLTRSEDPTAGTTGTPEASRA